MNRLAVILLTLLIGISLVAPSAFAQNNDTTRPGWGFGDVNHVHTGPPGQSVRPHQENKTNVSFQISNSSDTGHNTVHHSSGPVTIVTGAVTNIISFVIKSGSNIFHI